ncbi:MAG: hypothetical protein HY675_11430 [Chloroflexi bacterium]|nr:hypothetical protein [Chloroflexota bacterium]
MNRTKGISLGSRGMLESQDDIGYLTGQRSPAEREKQIRTPLQKSSEGAGDREYGVKAKRRKS